MTSRDQVDIIAIGKLGLFEALAEMYATREAAIDLLRRAQVQLGRMPAFGEPTLGLYWQAVFTKVNHGMAVPGGALGIVWTALEDYPQHQVLQKAVVGRQSGPRRVVCLMASPTDAARLRLEAEYRELRAIGNTSTLVVEQVLATRVDDIIPELLRHKADVLHFAGHGTAAGQLVFESEHGRAAPVALGALARVLTALGPFECVVLNSCFAGGYATELLGAAPYVIGSVASLADSCATLFVSSFYRAVATGRPVPEAYEVARVGLALRRGCVPEQMRIEVRR